MLFAAHLDDLHDRGSLMASLQARRRHSLPGTKGNKYGQEPSCWMLPHWSIVCHRKARGATLPKSQENREDLTVAYTWVFSLPGQDWQEKSLPSVTPRPPPKSQ
jgi:hypothetical protein